MGTSTYTMTSTDMIYGSINAGGNTLAGIASTGYNSIEQVSRQLRETAGRFAGIGTISIRNKSQGWSVELPIATATCRPRAYSVRHHIVA